MTATITPTEIAVRHSVVASVNREFLTVNCPKGWEDVEKLKNKVLTYEGGKYTFSGWNSDRNEMFFTKPIHSYEHQIATIED